MCRKIIIIVTSVKKINFSYNVIYVQERQWEDFF